LPGGIFLIELAFQRDAPGQRRFKFPGAPLVDGFKLCPLCPNVVAQAVELGYQRLPGGIFLIELAFQRDAPGQRRFKFPGAPLLHGFKLRALSPNLIAQSREFRSQSLS
jgi:hypothetical protein